MVLTAKLYIILLSFLFSTHFFSEASDGQYCAHGPKTTLKLLVHVQAITPNPYIEIEFSKLKGLNPPPLKTYRARGRARRREGFHKIHNTK